MAPSGEFASGEVSDLDSISVTSTVASEVRSVYDLEEVLAEGTDDDGQLHYLIKWEGYPVERATWEPAESLSNGAPETLHYWQEKKMKVSRGLAEPFDVDAWTDEQDEIEAAKAHRKRARRAKRLRLGLLVSEDEAYEVSDGTASSESSDDNVPTINRRRSRKAEASPEVIVIEDDENPDPVRQKKTEKGTAQIVRDVSAKLRQSDKQGPASKASASRRDSASTSGQRSREPAAPIKPSGKSTSAKPSDRPSISINEKAAPAASATVRKSASATTTTTASASATAKKSGPGLFASWQKVPKRRLWERTDASKPNREGKRFNTVSEVRRFELYGRNEREPNQEDLDRLGTCAEVARRRGSIPTLGTGIINDLSTEATAGPQHVKLNLGSFNPRNIDAKSKESHEETTVEQHSKRIEPPADQLEVSEASGALQKSRRNKVPVTCRYWHEGNCPFDDTQCPFTHQPTDMLAPLELHQQCMDEDKLPKFHTPPLTCYFWRFRGHCHKTIVTCKYAHWITGLVAPTSKRDPAIPDGDSTVSGPRRNTESLHQSQESAKQPWAPKKELTCFFWQTGTCRLSAEDCEYAHHQCEVNAPPPPGWKPLGVSASPPPLLPPPQHAPQPPPAADDAQGSASPFLFLDQPVIQQQQNSSEPYPFTFSMEPVLSRNAKEPTDVPVIPHAVMAHLLFRDDSAQEALEIQIVGFNTADRERFATEMGHPPLLEAQHICLADDYRQYLYTSGSASGFSGEIVPTTSSSAALKTYAEELRLRASGVLVLHRTFLLVIFPAHHDPWDFLKPKCSPTPQAVFHFHIQSIAPDYKPVEQDSMIWSNKVGKMEIETVFHQLFGIEPERLFAWIEGAVLDKIAFLLFPPDREDEIKLVTRFLQAAGAKVYHGSSNGSWEYFYRKTTSGIVLFHPDVCCYHQIPHLGPMTRGRYNFFQIGCDMYAKSENGDVKYNCVELFPPLGSVVFVTDDLFAHHPGKALDIVRHILKKNSGNTVTPWKLAGRPGLKRWLLELCHKHEEEVLAGKDKARVDLYQSMDSLVPPELEDRWNRPNPSEEALLISVPPEQLPEYHELWLRDEKAASDFMMNWFAGWACTQVMNWRRFVAVHAVDRQNWKDAYRHLDLLTPERYTEKYDRQNHPAKRK